jgi:predicted permease
MNVFVITLQAVFTLLGIGVLGFWVIGQRKPPSAIFGFLSTLAIDIALPCLVLANLIKDFSPEKFPDWWLLPLWWMGFTVVALALTLLGSRVFKKETRCESMTALFYQNGAFPVIITGLMGPTNAYLDHFLVFIPCIRHCLALLLLRGPPGSQIQLRRIINPVLVTTIIGPVISLLNKRFIPDFVINISTLEAHTRYSC